jgi:hypothetical protein
VKSGAALSALNIERTCSTAQKKKETVLGLLGVFCQVPVGEEFIAISYFGGSFHLF